MKKSKEYQVNAMIEQPDDTKPNEVRDAQWPGKNARIPITLYLDGAPESEIDVDFLQKKVTAMAVSFFKYGAVKDAYPEKVDAIATARKQLELYLHGGVVKGHDVPAGNKRYLVAASNYIMIESMAPRHPEAHWGPDDSHTSPGRAMAGGFTDRDNNLLTQREKIQHDIAPPDISKIEKSHTPGSVYYQHEGD